MIQLILNTLKKPVDGPRVRRALTLLLDRWDGPLQMAHLAIAGHVVGLLRSGYDLARPDTELEALPGFSRNMVANRTGGPVAAAGGRAGEARLQTHEPRRAKPPGDTRHLDDRPVTAGGRDGHAGYARQRPLGRKPFRAKPRRRPLRLQLRRQHGSSPG